jgi:DNA repair exonuclease SbcCD ATPase subunit
MADEDDKTKKEAEVEAASESTDQAADSTAEGTPESDNLQKIEQMLVSRNAASKQMYVGAMATLFIGAGAFILMAAQLTSKVGQVDDMLEALTKRAVNMNAALSAFDELNETIQEMGIIQAQFSDQQGLLSTTVTALKTEIPEMAARKVAIENTVVANKISVLESSLKSHGEHISKASASIESLSSRINKFEGSLKNVANLNADVKALVTLERENYLAVLKRQSMLQEAKSGEQVIKVPRDPNLIFYSLKTP